MFFKGVGEQKWGWSVYPLGVGGERETVKGRPEFLEGPSILGLRSLLRFFASPSGFLG